MKVFSCLFGKICSLFKYVKGYYLYNKLNKKLRLSENEIAFIPSWGIGDHIIVASLASEIKSHYDANSFVLVVRQKFASLGLEKLFKSIDKVVYVKDKVFWILLKVITQFCVLQVILRKEC